MSSEAVEGRRMESNGSAKMGLQDLLRAESKGTLIECTERRAEEMLGAWNSDDGCCAWWSFFSLVRSTISSDQHQFRGFVEFGYV